MSCSTYRRLYVAVKNRSERLPRMGCGTAEREGYVLGTFLCVFVVLFFSSVCVGQKTGSANSRLEPSVVVDLKNVGWMPAPSESNQSFFRRFTMGKLEALDDTTKILFLTTNLVVVYHTTQQGKDWRTAIRKLEAFFISAETGRLVQSKVWPTVARRSADNLRDSEARLVPLQDGQFLVMANGKLMQYANNLELIREMDLRPFTSDDLWAAQSVAQGKRVFLRHESRSDSRVTYSWLASDTLTVLFKMPGYEAKDFDVLRNVIAGEQAVFIFSTAGIRMITAGPVITTICDSPLCKADGETFRSISSRYLAVSGKTGIGLVDINNGLVWSRSVRPEYDSTKIDSHMFQFGEPVSDVSGTKLCVWVTSQPNGVFDGIKTHSRPTLFIYDTARLQRLSTIVISPVSGQWDTAVSPEGRKIAVYDGSKLKIYRLNDEVQHAF